MSDTEFDVVIAAYLIPDLAQQDFDALVKLVTDKQLTVEGVALVTNDVDGKVTITETGDARSLQYPAAALAAAAPKDRANPDPRRSEVEQLRPRMLRIADVVLQDMHAAALVPEIGRGAPGSSREALRGLRGLPSVLEPQLEGGQDARYKPGRRIPRWDSFHIRRRRDPVVAVTAQLLRQGRDARAIPRDQDSAYQSQTGLQ